MAETPSVDLLVIGGGINGAGIARDAAGRGLSTVLCEKGDLAEGTSSRSSKMIHGGLRYLEHYEFRLVRKALREREVLLGMAPHIIWPLRFVLPHSPNSRPAWLVRLGLFLYDHLGGRKLLPPTRSLDLINDPEGGPMLPEFKRGFEYSDCWVDDARLVVLNALDAHERGAEILTRTRVTSAARAGGHWIVTVQSDDGQERQVNAKALVNAAGPWVSDVAQSALGAASRHQVRLVKGSHIVVQKFWDGPQGYLLQNDDERVVFVIPFGDEKALIGTTDIPYAGRPEDVQIDQDERDYLIRAANRYFKRTLSTGDILDEFSGLRPLFDDGNGNPSAITRDYTLELDENGPPVLHVLGGKVTTYRELSAGALQKLAKHFPKLGGDWTHGAPLPGGDLPGGDLDRFVASLAARYPWLSAQMVDHYVRHYGTRSLMILQDARSTDDLGHSFGPLLHEAEARYLIQHEWARTAQDILMRRTKLHLSMRPEDIHRLERWMARQVS